MRNWTGLLRNPMGGKRYRVWAHYVEDDVRQVEYESDFFPAARDEAREIAGEGVTTSIEDTETGTHYRERKRGEALPGGGFMP